MEAARKAIFVLDDVLDMSFVPPASWGAVRSRWQYRYKGLPVESLTTRMTRPSIGRPWPSWLRLDDGWLLDLPAAARSLVVLRPEEHLVRLIDRFSGIVECSSNSPDCRSTSRSLSRRRRRWNPSMKNSLGWFWRDARSFSVDGTPRAGRHR